MTTIDQIRPYHDHEVNAALKEYSKHPMIKALFRFAFPQKELLEIDILLNSCRSIRDFQERVIYPTILRLLEQTSEGLSTSGFDKLEPNTSYLFISNHRDIVLDTSLLNMALLENGLVMTASAIGDNLVNRPFLMALSRLNRNFLIRRGLGPREMLSNSKLVSEYIHSLLLEDNRSVWIAQREGRTKDGNDRTHQGVLKMLAMANDEDSPMAYFKKLKIVPVAISYEFDPTDMLKMPELMANYYEEEYVKTINEDFNSIMKGALGQKKHIHIAVSSALDRELDFVRDCGEPTNKQFQLMATLVDSKIHECYRLWPSNYIAYDLWTGQRKYGAFYNEKEERQFMRRIERRVDRSDKAALENFLLMYANPVINKEHSNE